MNFDLHCGLLINLIVNVMLSCFFFSCFGSCDSQLVGIVPGPWHTILVESAVNWSYIIKYIQCTRKRPWTVSQE